jgi:hypothetical protein
MAEPHKRGFRIGAVASPAERWPGESWQPDKWDLCLTRAKMAVEQER